MCIHDPPNRLRGQLPDRRQNFVARLRATRVHNHDAVIADLYRHVGARPNKHVDVALDVEGFDFALRGLSRRAHIDRRSIPYRGGKRSRLNLRHVLGICRFGSRKHRFER